MAGTHLISPSIPRETTSFCRLVVSGEFNLNLFRPGPEAQKWTSLPTIPQTAPFSNFHLSCGIPSMRSALRPTTSITTSSISAAPAIRLNSHVALPDLQANPRRDSSLPSPRRTPRAERRELLGYRSCPSLADNRSRPVPGLRGEDLDLSCTLRGALARSV